MSSTLKCPDCGFANEPPDIECYCEELKRVKTEHKQMKKLLAEWLELYGINREYFKAYFTLEEKYKTSKLFQETKEFLAVKP